MQTEGLGLEVETASDLERENGLGLKTEQDC